MKDRLHEYVDCWVNKRTGYVIELWMSKEGKPFIVSQHIRVFYEHNHRRPKPEHDLHHIDGNKQNNLIWNLLEMPKKAHEKLHKEREKELKENGISN